MCCCHLICALGNLHDATQRMKMSKLSEKHSTPAGGSDTAAPVGVSQHVWQKFQNLRKRRLASAATEESVEDEGETVCKSAKQGKRDGHDDNESPEASSSGTSKEWTEVKKYMGAHDHLKGIDHGKYAPKTELEKKIDKAVAAGKFDLAEQLSDHLATREFGKRIADALDAKKFDKEKKEEEERKNKNKKKVEWWNAPKQRWETKSNM